jgi:hypothetical protein
VFYIDVASILYRCCNNILECCTCCNGYTCMFQVYVANVLSVSDVCCKCFHLDVAKVDLDVAYTCTLEAYVSSVSYVSCKCFTWLLHIFAMA